MGFFHSIGHIGKNLKILVFTVRRVLGQFSIVRKKAFKTIYWVKRGHRRQSREKLERRRLNFRGALDAPILIVKKRIGTINYSQTMRQMFLKVVGAL